MFLSSYSKHYFIISLIYFIINTRAFKLLSRILFYVLFFNDNDNVIKSPKTSTRMFASDNLSLCHQLLYCHIKAFLKPRHLGWPLAFCIILVIIILNNLFFRQYSGLNDQYLTVNVKKYFTYYYKTMQGKIYFFKCVSYYFNI